MKIFNNLNLACYNEYFSLNKIIPLSVQECTDGIILSGYAEDASANKFPWLAKVDDCGQIPTAIDHPKANNSLFEIRASLNSILVNKEKGDKIIVTDMLGSTVSVFDNVKEENFVSIPFFEKPGIYFISILEKTEILMTKKILIYNK